MPLLTARDAILSSGTLFAVLFLTQFFRFFFCHKKFFGPVVLFYTTIFFVFVDYYQFYAQLGRKGAFVLVYGCNYGLFGLFCLLILIDKQTGQTISTSAEHGLFASTVLK